MERFLRNLLFGVLATCAVALVCHGEDGVLSGDQGTPHQMVDVQEIECTPVATSWPQSETGPYQLQGPQLAVVRTDFRPKDTHLFLDGRYVGRARSFNGKKGFLYLEPGDYRIEAVAKGYGTDVFLVRARPNCRFDVKHRMIKGHHAAQVARSVPDGKGDPVQWIWGPVAGSAPVVAPVQRGGADPSLRPDLTGAPRTSTASATGKASIRLRVQPLAASVYLDGEFLATAKQLDLTVSPLAVVAGVHRIEVLAPGYIGTVEEVTLAEVDVQSIEIDLVAAPD